MGYKVDPRLQNFFRQVEVKVVSNSGNKIHQTWDHYLASPCSRHLMEVLIQQGALKM